MNNNNYNNNVNNKHKLFFKKHTHSLSSTANKIGIALIILTMTYYFIGKLFSAILEKTDSYYYNIDAVLYLINGIVSVVGMMLPAIVLILLLKTPIDELIKVKKVKANMLIPLIFAGLSICMVANFAVDILYINLSFLGIDNSVNFHSDATDAVSIIINIITVAITPALVEEFLFRGVILGSLKKYGNSFAILISAVLFGLCHGNFVQIPFAFVVGLVLGFVTVYSKSIVPAIFIHLFNNLFSVLLGIIFNNCSAEIYQLISVISMCLILVLGLISFVIILNQDKNFLKCNTIGTECINMTFKKKITTFLFSAGLLLSVFLFLVESCMVFYNNGK